MAFYVKRSLEPIKPVSPKNRLNPDKRRRVLSAETRQRKVTGVRPTYLSGVWGHDPDPVPDGVSVRRVKRGHLARGGGGGGEGKEEV